MNSCPQPEISHRRAAGCVPRLSRAVQRPPDHLRICDAQGRERHLARRQGPGAAALRAFPPRSTSFRSIRGRERPMNARTGSRSSALARSSTGPDTPVRSGRPEAGTSWPPADSSGSESVRKLRAAERGRRHSVQLRTGLAGGQARDVQSLGPRRYPRSHSRLWLRRPAGLFVLVTLGLERITRAAHGPRPFDDDGIGTLFDFLRSGPHLAAAANTSASLGCDQ